MAFAFRGNAFQTSFGHQTAEGTTVTPTQSYKWLSGSNVDVNPKITDEYEGDGTIDISFQNKDREEWKFKIQWFPRAQDLGLILGGVLGSGSETLGVAPTGATIATSGTGGSIAANTYHYAWCFLYNQVEGTLSADLSITTTGSTSTVTISAIPTDSNATGVRVYKGAGGAAAGVYTLSTDLAAGTTTVTDTGTTPVFVANNEYNTAALSSAAAAQKAHFYTSQSILDFYTLEYGMIAPVTASSRIMAWLADAQFTMLTIEADPNMPLKATLEGVAKYNLPQSSLITPVFDASKPLKMSNATFVKDGVSTTAVSKFKLTYTNMINENIITTHIYPETFILERRKLALDYTLYFANAQDYWKFISGGTTTNPTSNVIVDNAGIATGTLAFRFVAGGTDYSNQFGMSVPNVSYTPTSVTPNLDGKPFMMPIKGIGLTSTGNPFCSAALLNARTTVY